MWFITGLGALRQLVHKGIIEVYRYGSGMDVTGRRRNASPSIPWSLPATARTTQSRYREAA